MFVGGVDTNDDSRTTNGGSEGITVTVKSLPKLCRFWHNFGITIAQAFGSLYEKISALAAADEAYCLLIYIFSLVFSQ